MTGNRILYTFGTAFVDQRAVVNILKNRKAPDDYAKLETINKDVGFPDKSRTGLSAHRPMTKGLIAIIKNKRQNFREQFYKL